LDDSILDQRASKPRSGPLETRASGLSESIAGVFLLAENRLLREALVRILSKREDLRVVGAAPYSNDVVQRVVSSSPNIVVLDSIATALAEKVISSLHRLNSGIKIVMVGMEADEAEFLRVVQEGAVGYVLKDASALEVAHTIRAVAAGEAVCPPSLSAALFRWVARHRVTLPSLHLKQNLGFSLREQQLVSLIRDGLSNKEMAARLNISEQTVKNHVYRMLRKVGAPDRLVMVELCRAEGVNF
jgi:two-component system, NarL family, response regulator DevR